VGVYELLDEDRTGVQPLRMSSWFLSDLNNARLMDGKQSETPGRSTSLFGSMVPAGQGKSGQGDEAPPG